MGFIFNSYWTIRLFIKNLTNSCDLKDVNFLVFLGASTMANEIISLSEFTDLNKKKQFIKLNLIILIYCTLLNTLREVCSNKTICKEIELHHFNIILDIAPSIISADTATINLDSESKPQKSRNCAALRLKSV